MFKRFLGLLMLLIGLSGIWVGWQSAQTASTAVANIGSSLDSNLTLLGQSLDTITDSLQLARQTVKDVGAGLDTVEITAENLSQAIDGTQPLLAQVSSIAGNDVPESIEAVQAAIPNMAEVAGAIDSTLSTLNRFKIDEAISIPNPFANQPLYTFNLNFDLGIDYDPTVPFDQTVRQLGASTEGLPAELRTLAGHIDTSSQSLEQISQGVEAIGESLGVVNGRIAELNPLLEEYSLIVTQLSDQTRQVKAGMNDQLESIQQTINIIMIWFILTQIAPLYLGYELLTGRRATQKQETAVGL